ncbi:MAG TPA: DUF3445 domain-containing protein [Ilumatobacter sp.]|nr:DUF3445 domain-containing protein [Ilumatobacter sp.]
MVVPPPYQPFLDTAPTPFRWRLGLRPLDLADWIQVDEHFDADIAAKQLVSERFPTTVFQVLHGADVDIASHETYTLVATHLKQLDPARFAAVPDHPGDVHPLEAAGRLVQEDLILLVERDRQLVCGGGSVCFPNRWHLAGKVGLTMAQIHAPVHQLNEQLEHPIDRTMERLTVERPFWRLGYGLLDTDLLYQAVDGTAERISDVVDPTDYYLRVERETLRRLPDTGSILFTIRTYINPIGDIAPEAAARLADAIEAMPAGVADYKKLTDVGPAIIEWLRDRTRTQG